MIKSRPAQNLAPGDYALKRISDGHYYGTVASVVHTDNRMVVITFEDGEAITRRALDPVIVDVPE